MPSFQARMIMVKYILLQVFRHHQLRQPIVVAVVSSCAWAIEEQPAVIHFVVVRDFAASSRSASI
ncbi:hypothetical protein PPTG_24728 [Phytophthora nicotianae INRA-310]|uniref:Uncharacterized protein n=1 Tax=Phytophthora nicotianae (strain INRA-310) TaxID=761204 RepID=W2PCZ1_PHYN3|nr:hypothetical protein PPTG_24728 [Phytophthora nicotianae INRA-310]ETM98088.1 hypothetical protein PPTG_24728 [Phytophthora nicotianae INRA-310]